MIDISMSNVSSLYQCLKYSDGANYLCKIIEKN